MHVQRRETTITYKRGLRSQLRDPEFEDAEDGARKYLGWMGTLYKINKKKVLGATVNKYLKFIEIIPYLNFWN